MIVRSVEQDECVVKSYSHDDFVSQPYSRLQQHHHTSDDGSTRPVAHPESANGAGSKIWRGRKIL
jgi:hypothetical protein